MWGKGIKKVSRLMPGVAWFWWLACAIRVYVGAAAGFISQNRSPWAGLSSIMG
jgi:hypothetical protein